jgi:hypothetical protein
VLARNAAPLLEDSPELLRTPQPGFGGKGFASNRRSAWLLGEDRVLGAGRFRAAAHERGCCFQVACTSAGPESESWADGVTGTRGSANRLKRKFRRRCACGPCDDERRECGDRRRCACGCGSRGSSCGDGCWVGRFSSWGSLSVSVRPGGPRDGGDLVDGVCSAVGGIRFAARTGLGCESPLAGLGRARLRVSVGNAFGASCRTGPSSVLTGT